MLLTNKTFQKYNGRTGVIIGLTWCIATFILRKSIKIVIFKITWVC